MLAPAFLFDVLSYLFIMQIRQLDHSSQMMWLSAVPRIGGTAVGVLTGGVLGLKTKLDFLGVGLGYLGAMIFSLSSSYWLWRIKMKVYPPAPKPTQRFNWSPNLFYRSLQHIQNESSNQNDLNVSSTEEKLDNTSSELQLISV